MMDEYIKSRQDRIRQIDLEIKANEEKIAKLKAETRKIWWGTFTLSLACVLLIYAILT